MAVRLLVRHPRSATGEAGEISFEFEQPRIVIGRGPGADVRLPGTSVSDLHATIEQQGSHYALRDEGSTNGTLVNDAQVVPRRARSLVDGDIITVAEFTLLFHEGPLHRAPTGPERTASLARRMLGELLGEESEARKPPYLRVVDGPQAGTLLNLGEPGTRFVIGRGEDAHLVLNHVDVSRAHLELVRDLDGTLARDLASKNGLEVNGRKLRERRLRHGDVIRLGGSDIVYQDPDEHALRALEGQPDVPLTRTHTAVATPPEPQLPEPPVDDADEPEPEPALVPRTPADTMVYMLAMLVLSLSLVGLAWLFK